MKNYEKYADEIRECEGYNFCEAFIIPTILKSDNCGGIGCYKCRMLQTIWLMEDYEEPEIGWGKVEVDTPILVRHDKDDEWLKRHFAKYENGRVYSWSDGYTSWSAEGYTTWWNFAKLAESEDSK